jgi:hypothetical protein
MKTHFTDFTNTHPSKIQEEMDHIEDLGTYESPRMMVFENYWGDSIFNGFNNQSVKPFLENIGQMIGEPVNVGHRYINSKTDLQYYLKNPGGVIWNNPETFRITYFGIHGSRKGFPLTQGLVSKKEILEMCSGFKDFPTILYFGSCSLFEDDDQFGYDLLSCGTGIRGVIGYKKRIPFTTSMLIDLFFLSSFFLYKDGDPIDDIECLYQGVIEEFPISKELGFTLYC